MRHVPVRLTLLFLCTLILIPSPSVFAASQPAYPEVVFILDGSGSMWGAAGDQTKIEAAKQVMEQITPALPAEVRVGLVAYGHRRKGDCNDVETLIPAGSDDRQGLLEQVRALSPKGKTPMASSVQQVAESLRTKENETTIILVSDGVETCHDDPCALVKSFTESGVKFVLHVVGFDVDAEGAAQLQCLADAGNGSFFAVSDAASLLAALETVNATVEEKVEKAKTTTVKKATGLGKLQVTLPDGAGKSLAGLRIIRASDGKTLKETEKAAGAHPLPAGDYEVVFLYKQPNYRDPDPASLGVFTIGGGETVTLPLGSLALNVAEELTDAVEGVVIAAADGEVFLTHHSPDNDYYIFKPRPMPKGVYDVHFLLANNETPYPVASGVEVAETGIATVTLDSGLQLQQADGVKAWELFPLSGDARLLRVERRWDNQYPLWKAFPVPPGSYELRVEIDGMTELLPVGQVDIGAGETIVFDTGL